jgi:hypothetical protein
LSPRATSASAICDPMKPAPPLTKNVRIVQFLKFSKLDCWGDSKA